MEKRIYNFSSIGFALSFEGPALAADIDRILGNPSATEEAFMQQYVYQDRAPEFRKALVERLIEHTGVARKTKAADPAKPDAKPVWDETEAEYINRVELIKGDNDLPVLTEADKLTIANEVNEAIGEWSPTTSSRSSKPAKKYYDFADGLIAKIAGGHTTAEKVIANFEAKIQAPFSRQYGEFNRDNLARAVKDVQERAAAEAERAIGL